MACEEQTMSVTSRRFYIPPRERSLLSPPLVIFTAETICQVAVSTALTAAPRVLPDSLDWGCETSARCSVVLVRLPSATDPVAVRPENKRGIVSEI
jgi:hypothetical protein